VSQFAAGCAICGYDLAAARRERAARRRLELPSLPRPAWLGSEAWVAAVLLLLVVFMPMIGLLLAGFIGVNANNEGRIAIRNIAIATGAIGLVLFLVPAWRYGIFSLLY
jgi:hypothetical protein